MLQHKYLSSNCGVKHDIHVEMENSAIWLLQAEKDLADHSVYIWWILLMEIW